MTKPTPTPWAIVPGYDWQTICGPNGDRIGTVKRLTGSDAKVGMANARLIVRAVNSHEALVEALTTLINDAKNVMSPEYLDQARAALSLARGEDDDLR